MRRTTCIGAGLVLSGTCALAAPAQADPPPGGFDVWLTCGSEVVHVSTAGNGTWTPAHDLDTSLVGVPLAFGEFTGTFTPTGGDPETFVDPAVSKKNVPSTRNLVVDCTYTVTGASPDGTFTGSGSVTLMVPRLQ